MSAVMDGDGWPPSAGERLALLDVQTLIRRQLGGEAADIHIAQTDALLAEPRFHDRLLRLLVGDAADLPAVDAPGDRLLLRATDAQLAGLRRACGVVCQAQAFARAIQAPQVQALNERFGRPLCALALRHRALAWSSTGQDDPDLLEVLVETDGDACLAAWFATLPAPLQRWMRLRGLEAGAAVDDDYRDRRVALVRAVAVDWLAAPAGEAA